MKLLNEHGIPHSFWMVYVDVSTKPGWKGLMTLLPFFLSYFLHSFFPPSFLPTILIFSSAMYVHASSPCPHATIVYFMQCFPSHPMFYTLSTSVFLSHVLSLSTSSPFVLPFSCFSSSSYFFLISRFRILHPIEKKKRKKKAREKQAL